MYLWGLGNYKYESERRPLNSPLVRAIFVSSYEEAMKKFEDKIDFETGVLM